MSEETKQNEGEDRQEQSELSDDQLEQAAGGAVMPISTPLPQQQLKVEEGEKIIGPAELVGNNFEEIKVTYTENDSKG